MNDTGNRTSAPSSDIAIVTCLYGLVSLAGVMLHLMVMVAIAKQPNHRTGFYVLVQNLYITNLVMFFLYLFYAIPCIIAGQQVFGRLIGAIMGGLEASDFVAGLLATFLISVSRALAIGTENLYNMLFSFRLCIVYSVFTWLLGGLITFINWLNIGCVTLFDEVQFYFYDYCAYDSTSSGTVISGFVYAFVYGVGVFYLYAACAISRQFIGIESESVLANSRRHRLRLLLQAFCIWLALLSDIISFRVVPLFLTGLPAVLTTGIFVVGHTLVAPLCMIIFSRDIRHTIPSLFKRNCVAPVTLVQSGSVNPDKLGNAL